MPEYRPRKVAWRGVYRTIDEMVRPELSETAHPYAFDYKNSLTLIRDAVARGEKITIVGDYDADGICASAILETALRALGAEPTLRFPLRFAEGYGMSPEMIDEINSGLVITVDNGIAALDAVKRAKEKGLTVLVTDHHLPAAAEDGRLLLPEADCIIDPHVEELLEQPGYDYADYCGAGVALKLAEQLLTDAELLDRCYSFAATATVADIMPMTGENREIYKKGMRAILSRRTTEGLYQLYGKFAPLSEAPAGLAAYEVIPTEKISFYIAPCINAPSRLVEHAGKGRFSYVREGGDGAKIAYRTLTETDDLKASEYIGYLDTYNSSRKTFAEKALQSAMEQIKADAMEEDCPLLLYLPEVRPGVIGPVAGRVEKLTGKPAIVLNGTEICHGSGRSPESVHLKALLDRISDKLLNYGGHAGACGVSVEETRIPEVRAALQQAFREAYPDFTVDETLYYDTELREEEILPAMKLVSAVLAPFGPQNPEPMFLFRDFRAERVTVLKEKHLKLSNGSVDAMLFNAPEELLRRVRPGERICFVGRLTYNFFRGRAIPQIMIEEFC